MSAYVDHDIKERAYLDFIEIVVASNKSFGEKLRANRDCIYGRAIAHIQQIGVHSYAEKTLKRNSDFRNELLYLIDEE